MITLISTILNPVIAVLAVLNTSYRAEARIIASVAVQSFFGLIVLIFLFKKGKLFCKKEYWNFALRFNLPLFFYYISQSILNQSDRIMINYYEGSGKTAIYSVAYSAATIILLLVSAVNGSFNPWMYKKLKAGHLEEIRRSSGLLCLLIGGATLLMSLFAPILVRIMATSDYIQAIWVIPPVAVSVFFVFLYMMFANIEMYYNETGGIPLISILCSAANLTLNAIFIPVYGYIAASWTTLVCYMLLTMMHYVLMKKACKRHRVKEKIFPEKTVLLIAVGVVIMAYLVLLLYQKLL